MDLKKLLTEKPAETIDKLTKKSKNRSTIDNLIKEYAEHDRTIRETQVGKVQKDKIVGEGTNRKVIPGIRIKIPFQKRIVVLSTAFEVGEPVTITPNEENNLSEEVLRLWEINRIDDKLQKLKIIQKSETEVALLFYIKNLEKVNMFNRWFGPNKKRDIKTKILRAKNGIMTPVFDDMEDMIAFIWRYDTLVNEKTVKNVWIYDDTNVYILSDKSGTLKLDESKPHGFGKIPVVYMSQDDPEWYDVQDMIDRLETSMSKLGASNDYSGYPLLKLYGDVKGMPDRNDDGKTLVFPMKETFEDGKTVHGDAEFLTNSNAPESVKLELDRLEDYIYALSSTPNISFNNLKGIGNISGIALQFMFLDAILKAKINEGDNRTIISRIINVMISGTVTTIATSMSGLAPNTRFTVQFNSILPNDLKETVEVLSQAVNSKIMSRKTAVKVLDFAESDEDELDLIESDSTIKEPKKVKVTE